MTTSGTIRCGIGGWTFDPWEGTFYPETLAKKRQLEYASSQLKAIEVNGTYYGSQKPETFAKWASEVPDDFVFSLKASRFATNKKVLAEAGDSDRQVPWPGPDGAWTASRANPLAVHADQEIRCR